MKKILSFLKKHSDLIGYIALFILFTYMNVTIFFHLDEMMEPDFSSELVLAKLLANEKAIISTNWFYSTELRVVNSNLVSPILFFFTDDWHLVRILTIAIMELILFACYYYSASRLKIKHIPWIAFMIVGISSYEYFKYALLCSSYIPHICLAFLTFGLLIDLFSDLSKNKKTIRFIILLFLAYVGSLEGIRLVSVTYIPLLITCVVYCLIKQFDNLKEGKFDFKDESVKLFLICLAGLISSFLGTVTNLFILPKFGFSYKRDSVIIAYKELDIDSILAVVNGWLKVFGYQAENLPVFNLVQLILKALFLVTFIMICWSSLDILIHKEKYSKYEYFIDLYFFVAGIFMSALYIITTAWFRNRYLLPVSIFSVINIGVFLSHYKVNWQKNTYLAAVVLFIIFNTPYQINYFIENDTYKEYIEIKDILLENECYNGYSGDHWNGHNFLTELSDGKIETWRYSDNSIENIAQWLQVKEHVTKKPTGKVFLLQYTDNYYDGYNNINLKSDADSYIYYEDDLIILYIFDSQEQLESFIN